MYLAGIIYIAGIFGTLILVGLCIAGVWVLFRQGVLSLPLKNNPIISSPSTCSDDVLNRFKKIEADGWLLYQTISNLWKMYKGCGGNVSCENITWSLQQIGIIWLQCYLLGKGEWCSNRYIDVLHQY
jgi:hypothetical protein